MKTHMGWWASLLVVATLLTAFGALAEAQDAQQTRSPFREALQARNEKSAPSRGAGSPDFRAAQAAFRRALGLAATDNEKVEAVLGMGRAFLSDVGATDDPAAGPALRGQYARILGLKTLTPQQRAEALLGTAETYLLEKKYPAAREACAQARAATGETNWIAQAQMVLARSYLQERNYPAARQEFRRLLEMEGLERQLRWEAEALLEGINLLRQLRTDHPRLFFTAESWPAVKERALTVEKAFFDRIKAKVEGIPLADIRSRNWANPDYGSQQVGVMEAAFVYRVTGDPVTLEKVRRMLRGTLDISFGNPERAIIPIAWLAALDWVWNDLVPPERAALADAMIRCASKWVAEERARKDEQLTKFDHYYLGSMYWFGGVVLLEPSADDVAYARALALLGIGFKNYTEYFAEIIRRSGDDTAWQSNFGYDFCTLPPSYFVFLYAWQPATGAAMPKEWSVVGISPNLALRMVVGMGKDHIKDFEYAGDKNGGFGFGEQYPGPTANFYDNLGDFMNLFGQSHPQEAAIAHYLRRRMEAAGAVPWFDTPHFFFRFLRTEYEKAPPPVLPPGLPVARYFESCQGLVLMSSGFGPEDTYALYSQGGGHPQRTSDRDATHFSIYKKGFLALDTGTRFALRHSINYRHQTVAHNAVLIHMPGEHLKGSLTYGDDIISNAGGQNRSPTAAKALAFETDRLYVYTATDATPVYNPEKCAQMVRQFIYLPPDHFVVFDRVISKNADFPKTWLLHTANEPAIAGKEFRADQDQGRVFCRTLLPADAVLEKIGGPGKEFWADGKNWPIVDFIGEPGAGGWWKRQGRGHTSPPEAMGRWRVEVKPGKARTDDVFLHLIQASDRTVEKMVETQTSETADQVHVSFAVGPRSYVISLNKTGDVGGHIRITEGAKELVDRPLTQEVMRQTGLALTK